MNSKQYILELIKVAAYNGDTKKAMRLYCENRISRKAYDEVFNLGLRIKENEEKQKIQNN